MHTCVSMRTGQMTYMHVLVDAHTRYRLCMHMPICVAAGIVFYTHACPGCSAFDEALETADAWSYKRHVMI